MVIARTLRSLFAGSRDQYIYLRCSACSHKQTQISGNLSPIWKLTMARSEWFEVQWSREVLLWWSDLSLHVVTMAKRAPSKCCFVRMWTPWTWRSRSLKEHHIVISGNIFSAKKLLLPYQLKVVQYSLSIPGKKERKHVFFVLL